MKRCTAESLVYNITVYLTLNINHHRPADLGRSLNEDFYTETPDYLFIPLEQVLYIYIIQLFPYVQI